MSRLEDAMKVSVLPGGGALARTERAVALSESERIELDDLPPQVRGRYAEVLGPAMAAGDSLRGWASRYVRLVFEHSGRNRRETCRRLGISYHTLKSYLLYPQRTRRSRTQVSA